MKSYEDTTLRRIITMVMAAAIAMILIALLSAGLFFRSQAEDQRRRADAGEVDRSELRAELMRATDAIDQLLSQVSGASKAQAAQVAAATKQVSSDLSALINTLFASERKVSRAEADRQLAAIRAAQADLERRISAIVSGPQGQPGAQGAPGGSAPTLCLLCPAVTSTTTTVPKSKK